MAHSIYTGRILKRGSSVDALQRAIKRADKVNDGSAKDEELQNRLNFAIDEARKRVEYHCAVALRVDNWLPACNGTETPFETRTRRKLLYCWNPATGKHGYIDCGTDMLLSDEEAAIALGV